MLVSRASARISQLIVPRQLAQPLVVAGLLRQVREQVPQVRVGRGAASGPRW